MSKQVVTDVVAVGVVDEFEAIEIDHEEGGAGVIELGLLDSDGEAVLKETLVGKAGEMVVKGMPLIRRDLLFEQDQQHAYGDKKLLKVPDLIGHHVVPRPVRDPGVEQEDKRPNNETNDGNLPRFLRGRTSWKTTAGRNTERKGT